MAYSFTTSPLCQKIMSGNTQITTRIDGGGFIRNLGDVSLLFQFKKMVLGPTY